MKYSSLSYVKIYHSALREMCDEKLESLKGKDISLSRDDTIAYDVAKQLLTACTVCSYDSNFNHVDVSVRDLYYLLNGNHSK